MEVKRDGRLASSLFPGAGPVESGAVPAGSGGVRLAGRTDERVRRYSAGVAEVVGCFLTGAALAAGFGAGFAGFGGG